MNCVVEDIISFLKELACTDEIKSDSDIFADVGMVGDDFHEMIEKYAMRYSVDMKDYLWYFHTDEEGQNFGAFFFDPPYRLVKRIPVTPTMLAEFANKGKWDIKYPEHKMPKKRYDILINLVLVIVFVVWLIYKWLK